MSDTNNDAANEAAASGLFFTALAALSALGGVPSLAFLYKLIRSCCAHDEGEEPEYVADWIHGNSKEWAKGETKEDREAVARYCWLRVRQKQLSASEFSDLGRAETLEEFFKGCDEGKHPDGLACRRMFTAWQNRRHRTPCVTVGSAAKRAWQSLLEWILLKFALLQPSIAVSIAASLGCLLVTTVHKFQVEHIYSGVGLAITGLVWTPWATGIFFLPWKLWRRAYPHTFLPNKRKRRILFLTMFTGFWLQLIDFAGCGFVMQCHNNSTVTSSPTDNILCRVSTATQQKLFSDRSLTCNNRSNWKDVTCTDLFDDNKNLLMACNASSKTLLGNKTGANVGFEECNDFAPLPWMLSDASWRPVFWIAVLIYFNFHWGLFWNAILIPFLHANSLDLHDSDGNVKHSGDKAGLKSCTSEGKNDGFGHDLESSTRTKTNPMYNVAHDNSIDTTAQDREPSWTKKMTASDKLWFAKMTDREKQWFRKSWVQKMRTKERLWFGLAASLFLLKGVQFCYLLLGWYATEQQNMADVVTSPVQIALTKAFYFIFMVFVTKTIAADFSGAKDRETIEREKPIYLVVYSALIITVPWNLETIVKNAQNWAEGDTGKQLTVLLGLDVPLYLFPVHFLSDTYTEIVMAGLEADGAAFWVVLVVDVVFLVMRDADLYADLLEYMKKEHPQFLQLCKFSLACVDGSGEYLSGTPYITHSADMRGETSLRIVMTYGIFLCSQLIALQISYFIRVAKEKRALQGYCTKKSIPSTANAAHVLHIYVRSEIEQTFKNMDETPGLDAVTPGDPGKELERREREVERRETEVERREREVERRERELGLASPGADPYSPARQGSTLCQRVRDYFCLRRRPKAVAADTKVQQALDETPNLDAMTPGDHGKDLERRKKELESREKEVKRRELKCREKALKLAMKRRAHAHATKRLLQKENFTVRSREFAIRKSQDDSFYVSDVYGDNVEHIIEDECDECCAVVIFVCKKHEDHLRKFVGGLEEAKQRITLVVSDGDDKVNLFGFGTDQAVHSAESERESVRNRAPSEGQGEVIEYQANLCCCIRRRKRWCGAPHVGDQPPSLLHRLCGFYFFSPYWFCTAEDVAIKVCDIVDKELSDVDVGKKLKLYSKIAEEYATQPKEYETQPVSTSLPTAAALSSDSGCSSRNSTKHCHPDQWCAVTGNTPGIPLCKLYQELTRHSNSDTKEATVFTICATFAILLGMAWQSFYGGRMYVGQKL